MSLSIVQVVFILFTFLSFSKLNVVIGGPPNSWFKKNCKGAKFIIDSNLCLKILESQKKIVSSTNQIDLSVAIIESGISNGTSTRKYLENMLKKGNLNPSLKGVVEECKLAYDSAIGSLRSALSEVHGRDYQTATYDLLIAGSDSIDRCKRVVASKKINDATILIGNKVLPMFGYVGFNVVAYLADHHPPPPRSPPSS